MNAMISDFIDQKLNVGNTIASAELQDQMDGLEVSTVCVYNAITQTFE